MEIFSEPSDFSKVHFATIVEVLNRHCPIGIYAVKLKILSEASCQSCMEEGEVEIFLANQKPS